MRRMVPTATWAALGGAQLSSDSELQRRTDEEIEARLSAPKSYAARLNACYGPQISDRNQRLLDSVPAFEPGMEKLKVKLSNVHKFATGRPVRSGPQNAGLNGNFVL